MIRLTAHVSGSVQKVGYRGRVVQIATALGLRGIIENLSDGRVKIIAEGDEEKLKWFEESIEIKNTLIQVSSVEKSYSEARGDLSGFYKLVGLSETDSRLDQGVEVLKEILVAVKDMNTNLSGKIDGLGDCLGGKIDSLGGKTDCLGGKVDCLSGKMEATLEKQDDLLDEVREARKDLKSYLDQRFEQIEIDVGEMKAALKAKGII